MHFTTAVDINATNDSVWHAVADVEEWPRWTESMREIAWLDGDGPTEGARARVKQPGMPAMVWTVTKCVPGRSFDWRTASPGVATVGTHELEPTEDGVRLTLGIEQTGPLAGLAGLLMGGRTRRYVRQEAEGLKRCAEAGAGQLSGTDAATVGDQSQEV